MFSGFSAAKERSRLSKKCEHNAGVAELVDALDLGSSAARRESSSLSSRTIMFQSFVSQISYIKFLKFSLFILFDFAIVIARRAALVGDTSVPVPRGVRVQVSPPVPLCFNLLFLKFPILNLLSFHYSFGSILLS